MKVLIGNTGLVGKTLSSKVYFDLTFNSKNMNEYLDKVEDGAEIYLSCLPATKWLVNKDLKGDLENMRNIINIVSQKKYSKVILISTIDVYNDSPLKSDEDYSPNISKLSYGNNRYLFELMVREFIKTEELRIFRLPALFNKHIKKNVLFDLINGNNVQMINVNSSYQWYNLDNLFDDIRIYSELNPMVDLFNFFTEPIDTKELVELFPQYKDTVQYNINRVEYDYTTIYGDHGYISDKEIILLEIKQFIDEVSVK